MYNFDKSKFYLGKLCKHNHNYQESGKSLRYIEKAKGPGRCMECRKLKNDLRYSKPGLHSWKSLEEAFWFYVNQEDINKCWEWKGPYRKDMPTNKAYGRLEYKNKAYTAHRISWEIHNGDIPEGLLVCHVCDFPKCVNPHHLFLGTDEDNMRDRNMKERQARGEKHAKAKLTEPMVRYIRSLPLGFNQSELARQLNVTPGCISEVVNDKNWRHIK